MATIGSETSRVLGLWFCLAVFVARVLGQSEVLLHAPYLAPVPFRGKRNEPAHVALTLTKVADARGVSSDVFGEQVIANIARFFGLAALPTQP